MSVIQHLPRQEIEFKCSEILVYQVELLHLLSRQFEVKQLKSNIGF